MSRTIDACAFIDWSNQDEVTPYLTAGWREYIGTNGRLKDGGGAVPMAPALPYSNPVAGASDMVGTLRDHLDRNEIERAVLLHQSGRLALVSNNAYWAVEIARAANDWMVERCLSQDQRLYGTVLAPLTMPDEAVKEIRRAGKEKRMAAVMVGANGLGRPPGHPVFHPIYEAAAEMGLPIVLQAGAEALADTAVLPVAGGIPTSFVEYDILGTTPLHTYLVSLIGQGVFEKYPTLRAVVVGGGTAWIPFILWRFDREYRALQRETPWLRRHPSDYFREHVLVGTQPIERASKDGALATLLDSFGGLDRVLCYASGYSAWNADSPQLVTKLLPDSWRERVMYENALAAFRWDPVPSRVPPGGKHPVV